MEEAVGILMMKILIKDHAAAIVTEPHLPLIQMINVGLVAVKEEAVIAPTTVIHRVIVAMTVTMDAVNVFQEIGAINLLEAISHPGVTSLQVALSKVSTAAAVKDLIKAVKAIEHLQVIAAAGTDPATPGDHTALLEAEKAAAVTDPAILIDLVGVTVIDTTRVNVEADGDIMTTMMRSPDLLPYRKETVHFFDKEPAGRMTSFRICRESRQLLTYMQD